MKNTKEIQTILTAIYCINLSKRDKRDKDIDNICEYAFARILIAILTYLLPVASVEHKKKSWKK